MTGLNIKPLKFEFDASGLTKIEQEFERRCMLVVEKAAQEIRIISQFNVPVDQGVAKASHFVITESGSDRDEALVQAKLLAATEPSRYGHTGRTLSFDEDQIEVKHLHAYVCVGVFYALELEFGHISGSLNVRAENPGAQRPFLTPAVMEYESTFFQICREAFRNL